MIYIAICGVREEIVHEKTKACKKLQAFLVVDFVVDFMVDFASLC